MPGRVTKPQYDWALAAFGDGPVEARGLREMGCDRASEKQIVAMTRGAGHSGWTGAE